MPNARILGIGVLMAAALTPLQAGAQQNETSPASISEATIAQLKLGNPKAAINTFFGANPLVAEKKGEFTVLESQIGGAVSIYGKITTCELTETAKRGSLVEYRLYLCQHDHVVTRWRFLFVRGSTGWNGYNLSFDDKPHLPLNEP